MHRIAVAQTSGTAYAGSLAGGALGLRLCRRGRRVLAWIPIANVIVPCAPCVKLLRVPELVQVVQSTRVPSRAMNNAQACPRAHPGDRRVEAFETASRIASV